MEAIAVACVRGGPRVRGRPGGTPLEPACSAPLCWQPCGERRVGWGWEAWRRSAYAEGSQGRDVRAAWGPVLFPTHSPRQGDEVAINLHTSLSGGHYRLIEESFNSSLAHKSASD